ncbi:hypothetical protein [Demequina lutea]|uniref:Uncharacterized protein n=1 Tax=Demequina lutea TaxID=431489 RepID=A0A7Y9ZAH2_9MICO|nr:hypothetical protein [Demequina lutea]NYI41787.1 hypothetical protein [Demequina lutea]
MTEDVPSADFERGQRAERERFAEYLAHFERSSRALADQAVTDESRVYQVTIANAMRAMSQAIMGGFHWQESWRKE